MGVAFSPDGKTFLTGGGDASSGEARQWETLTRKPTGKIFPHQLMIRPVAFSPDGKTVLTGGGTIPPGSGMSQRAGRSAPLSTMSIGYRPAHSVLTGDS